MEWLIQFIFGHGFYHAMEVMRTGMIVFITLLFFACGSALVYFLHSGR